MYCSGLIVMFAFMIYHFLGTFFVFDLSFSFLGQTSKSILCISIN